MLMQGDEAVAGERKKERHTVKQLLSGRVGQATFGGTKQRAACDISPVLLIEFYFVHSSMASAESSS
jgi:hypothetical protein